MADSRVSVKRVAIAVVTVFAVLGIVAALLPSHSHPRWTYNEPAAVAALRTYCSAQQVFKRTPRYGDDTRLVFANAVDGKGFVDLWRVGGPLARPDGTELEIVDLAFAGATSAETPKSGYWFVDISADAEGPLDSKWRFGLCAVPARHGTDGKRTFIIGEEGTVHSKDNGGKPVTVWPDVEKEGWRPVGS